MKYISFVIVFLFFPFLGFSQTDSLTVASVSASKYSLELKAGFEGNSNSIPNSMMAKLLWGGNMSKDFLRKVREGMYDNGNRFGFEYKNAATFRWNSGQNEWQIGLKYRELLGLSYPVGLFQLGFLGNKEYEGREVNLSNLKFQYTQYSGLSFGRITKLNSGKSGVLYAGISFLYGLNNQSLRTRNAKLYTAPDAAYLQTEANMKLQYLEPSAGLGAGFDFNYLLEGKRNKMFFSVEDLGFMYWQKMTQFEGNASATYKGEEIATITNYTGDSLFSDFTARGFGNRFGVKESQKSSAQLLPFIFTARFQRQLNEKWSAILQANYTYMPAYIPRLISKMEKKIGRNWNVNLGLAYGGFGRENLLLGCHKEFSNSWSFSVDSYFLGMAFLPKSTYGIGANFSLRKSF